MKYTILKLKESLYIYFSVSKFMYTCLQHYTIFIYTIYSAALLPKMQNAYKK